MPLKKRQQPQGRVQQHQDRDAGRQKPEAGRRHCPQRRTEEREEVMASSMSKAASTMKSSKGEGSKMVKTMPKGGMGMMTRNGGSSTPMPMAKGGMGKMSRNSK